MMNAKKAAAFRRHVKVIKATFDAEQITILLKEHLRLAQQAVEAKDVGKSLRHTEWAYVTMLAIDELSNELKAAKPHLKAA